MGRMITAYNSTHLTMVQIAEAFGENIENIYKAKDLEITDELMPIYDTIDRINNAPLSDEQKSLAKTMAKGLLTDRQKMLLKSQEHIRKVRNMTRFYGIGGRRSKAVGMAIIPLEEVKQIPFEHIHEFQGIKRNRSGFMALCPLHIERSPSFSVKNNKFKCFSCGKSGSTVDFIMALYGMTFIDAVKWLQKADYRGGV